MSEKLGLGQIITTEQHRDAIHIAVVPVTAAMRINPGDHVTMRPDGQATIGAPGNSVGVADPFLPERIARGERFWLFLHPGSITSAASRVDASGVS